MCCVWDEMSSPNYRPQETKLTTPKTRRQIIMTSCMVICLMGLKRNGPMKTVFAQYALHPLDSTRKASLKKALPFYPKNLDTQSIYSKRTPLELNF